MSRPPAEGGTRGELEKSYYGVEGKTKSSLSLERKYRGTGVSVITYNNFGHLRRPLTL